MKVLEIRVLVSMAVLALVACGGPRSAPWRQTLEDDTHDVQSAVERCVVAQGDHLLVTLGDVQALRGNVLPPPRQAEAVRLAVAAAVAKGAEVRGWWCHVLFLLLLSRSQ